MMTIGIDLAREPDRTAWAVRAAGETNWQFHYDAEEFERVHGFSPLVRLASRAEMEAFDFRTPAHEERVECALQDRLRTHADRQGPCITAEQATSTATQMADYLRRLTRAHCDQIVRGFGAAYGPASSVDWWIRGALPSERLACRMGLGPRKYDGPCGLDPNLRAVSIGRAGWALEPEGAPR